MNLITLEEAKALQKQEAFDSFTPVVILPNEPVIITRKASISHMTLKPFIAPSFNCGGCRKRKPDYFRHILTSKGNYGRSPIWPKISICGEEACFNMALLRFSDKISKHKDIEMTPTSHKSYIKCALCKSYTKTDNNSMCFQSWETVQGREIKYNVYCSVDCFKFHQSKAI